MSCNTAKAVAANAQRTILAEAAAVDDLVGFKSVRRVPKAYNWSESRRTFSHRNSRGRDLIAYGKQPSSSEAYDCLEYQGH